MKIILLQVLIFCFLLAKLSLLQGQNYPVTPSSTSISETPLSIQYPGVNDIRYNSVLEFLPKQAITSSFDYSDFNESTGFNSKYFYDGKGQVFQNIHYNAGTGSNSIAQFASYDSLGRVKFESLPYPVAYSQGVFNSGIQTNASTDIISTLQSLPNNSNEEQFYNRYYFSKSPAKAGPIASSNPGEQQLGSGKKTYSLTYLAPWALPKWGIDFEQFTFPRPLNESNQYVEYNAYSLIAQEIIDQDGFCNITISDYSGKKLFSATGKRTSASFLALPSNYENPSSSINDFEDIQWTHYIYNLQGELRMVVPPLAIELIENNNYALTTQIINDLCFQYEYDHEGRLISKIIPNSGESKYVFDKYNRVILENSPDLDPDHWRFIKYNSSGSPIQMGICALNNSINREFIQDKVDKLEPLTGSLFLEYLINKDVFHNSEYVSNFNNVIIYETHYYNDYSFIDDQDFSQSSIFNDFTNGFNQTISLNPVNLLTGSILKKIGEPGSIRSINYYNSHGALLQTRTDYDSKVIYNSFGYNYLGSTLWHDIQLFEPNLSQNNSKRVSYKFSYDNNNRLLEYFGKLGNDVDYHRLVKYEYDVLGRLVKKHLGESTEEISKLNYEYDILGRTKFINKDFLQSGNSGHAFGMEVCYEQGANTVYSNGLISNVKWRNRGTLDKLRSYSYTYDSQKRLADANFHLYNPSTTNFDQNSYDFSLHNVDYDVNGNIQGLQRKGMKMNESIILDDLTYSYFNNSNRLKSVTESQSSESTSINELYDGLDDFRDNPLTTDYSYDVSGNLLSDLNKGITNINYDKYTKQIVSLDKDSPNKGVSYTYMANGVKLSKSVREGVAPNASIKRTEYVGPFQYIDGKLKHIGFNEGRLVCNDNEEPVQYEYYIKDYLSNVRSIISENYVSTCTLSTATDINEPAFYNATGEVQNSTLENTLFENIDNTLENKPQSPDPQNLKAFELSTALNSEIGPSIMLKVMAGDEISVKSDAFYLTSTLANNDFGQQVLDGFLAAIGATNLLIGNSEFLNSLLIANNTNEPGFVSMINTFLNNNSSSSDPNAFLSCLVFDEDMKLKDAQSLKEQVTIDNLWHTIQLPTFEANQNGYVYIFCSNGSDISVFFDDIEIEHKTGNLVEETHYYPFGQSFGRFTALPNYSDNKLLFTSQMYEDDEWANNNGLKWYDFDARNYDPQIARWHCVDQLSEQFISNSPYHYSYNNPISFIDPDGRSATLSGFNHWSSSGLYGRGADGGNLSAETRELLYGDDDSPSAGSGGEDDKKKSSSNKQSKTQSKAGEKINAANGEDDLGFSAGPSWNTSSGDNYFAGGVGAEIRGYLTTEFGKAMFDNYWFSHGNVKLTTARFNDIVSHAGRVLSSDPVTLSNGQAGVAQVHSFYGNNPYAAVLGSATIFYQGGNPVGFQDGYDFNWRWMWGEGSRTIPNELKTRAVSVAGWMHGATPFDITYGIRP